MPRCLAIPVGVPSCLGQLPIQPSDSEGQRLKLKTKHTHKNKKTHSFSALFLEIVTGMKFTYDCRHLITVSGDRWERPGGCPSLASPWEWWGEQGLRHQQRRDYSRPVQRDLLSIPAFSLFGWVHLGVTPRPQFKSQICHLFTCDLEQVISPF